MTWRLPNPRYQYPYAPPSPHLPPPADLCVPLTSVRQLQAFTLRHGRRGTIAPRLNYLLVRVPLWRVRRTRDAFELVRPVTYGVAVRPLSLLGHLTCWDVAVLR